MALSRALTAADESARGCGDIVVEHVNIVGGRVSVAGKQTKLREDVVPRLVDRRLGQSTNRFGEDWGRLNLIQEVLVGCLGPVDESTAAGELLFF